MRFTKFERLQRLGNEKFQKIVNELMRGIPAIMVARLILREWGDCNDVREDTLAKQLKRLHAAIQMGPSVGIWLRRRGEERVSESSYSTALQGENCCTLRDQAQRV